MSRSPARSAHGGIRGQACIQGQRTRPFRMGRARPQSDIYQRCSSASLSPGLPKGRSSLSPMMRSNIPLSVGESVTVLSFCVGAMGVSEARSSASVSPFLPNARASASANRLDGPFSETESSHAPFCSELAGRPYTRGRHHTRGRHPPHSRPPYVSSRSEVASALSRHGAWRGTGEERRHVPLGYGAGYGIVCISFLRSRGLDIHWFQIGLLGIQRGPPSGLRPQRSWFCW